MVKVMQLKTIQYMHILHTYKFLTGDKPPHPYYYYIKGTIFPAVTREHWHNV